MFPQLSNLKNTIIENELMQQINVMGGDVGGFGEDSAVVGLLVEGT
jgi:hypothetical protein